MKVKSRLTEQWENAYLNILMTKISLFKINDDLLTSGDTDQCRILLCHSKQYLWYGSYLAIDI